jgi:N6-L-threonylcarbamoyladenine synthase
MPYPGGPNIEKLANNGKNTYHMPNILDDDTLNFSFSGIKSHVNNLVHNAKQRGENIVKEDVARSFQDAVIKCNWTIFRNNCTSNSYTNALD